MIPTTTGTRTRVAPVFVVVGVAVWPVVLFATGLAVVTAPEFTVKTNLLDRDRHRQPRPFPLYNIGTIRMSRIGLKEGKVIFP